MSFLSPARAGESAAAAKKNAIINTREMYLIPFLPYLV